MRKKWNSSISAYNVVEVKNEMPGMSLKFTLFKEIWSLEKCGDTQKLLNRRRGDS